MTTLNAGTGADGTAVVSVDTDISSVSLVGRPYADMVPYQCSAVGQSSCTTTATPNGIEAGDEVLLINWQGISGDYGNVGNYETLIVDSVVSTTINFTTDKTMFYGDGTTDVNIGTGGSNQRVIVQRVPQYTDLTIDNGYTLTGSDAWDDVPGNGILFLRATGTILVNGSIDMTAKGYTGGYSNYSGTWYLRTGAGINGGPRTVPQSSPSWWSTSNLGGGARGGHNGSIWCCGAGGGYGTVGLGGMDLSLVRQTAGGSTYGEETLAKLFLGSGGGNGDENWVKQADSPADGGGIIALFATTLDVYGSILNDGYQGVAGQASTWPGGAGSGGSILIHAGTIYTRSSTFTAIGGVGKRTNQPTAFYGGDGGDGRIAISYAALGDNLSNVDPVPYADGNLELPYSISGTVNDPCTVRVYDTDWNFVKSQAASGAYSILNLPNAGPFNVVADPTSGSSNIEAYKNVSGVQ